MEAAELCWKDTTPDCWMSMVRRVRKELKGIYGSKVEVQQNIIGSSHKRVYVLSSMAGCGPEICINAMLTGIGFTWAAVMTASNRAANGCRPWKWKAYCSGTK